MCGFRWCGVAVVPLITVMQLRARRPRTSGSKRTWFTASVFATYTFPLVGRTAMLKMTVPTPLTTFVPPAGASGVELALIRKTSLSGSANGTNALQSRLISSTHWLPLNLTMRPVLGAPGVEPGGGGGRPCGLLFWLLTTVSVIVVVRLPELNTAA